MRRTLRILTAAAFFALPVLAAEPNEKSKTPSLDGVWEGWVVEGKGENPNRGQIHLQLTIKDNQVTGKKIGGGGGPGPDDMGAGTVTLADGEIKQMDATRAGGGGGPGRGGRGGRGGPGGGGGPGGPGGGGGYKGIVTVEGDTLKWCVANPGKDRPKEFATDRRQGQFLLILKKQEPRDKK